MVSLILNILGILGFVILLYLGMKISKQPSRDAKFLGYLLMFIAIIGLLADLYNLMHNYIFPKLFIN